MDSTLYLADTILNHFITPCTLCVSGGEKPVTDTLEEVYTIDVDDLVYDGEKSYQL